MSSPIALRLREQLQALNPLELDLIDDSARHAGHAGANGGAHFQVRIVSRAFAGKSTVARHRMIYSAAGDLMLGPVHALSISALTPDEL